MEIREEKKGDAVVLNFEGELMGGEEIKQFHDRIYRAIEEGTVQFVIDMSKVKWMNSSGLGMLMAGLTTLRSSGGDLKLVGVSERVSRPIEVTKLDNVLLMYGSVDEAVASFSSGG